MTYRTTSPTTRDEAFELLTALVAPRPVAWVSTMHPSGTRNLAPFSFYTVVSTHPPMLAITIERRRDGSEKDTLNNLRLTGELVVNTLSISDAATAHLTSSDLRPEVDEFAMYGIPAVASERVLPPRVGTSVASFECTVVAIHQPGSDSLVLARVLAVHVGLSAIDRHGRVDPTALRAAGRIGTGFAEAATIVSLPAPA